MPPGDYLVIIVQQLVASATFPTKNPIAYTGALKTVEIGAQA